MSPSNHTVLELKTRFLKIEEQRRALDANGLRYMISMQSFYIINQGVPSKDALSNGTAPKQSARRERLRYRDMIWAFFSESQDLLLRESSDACGGKMTWSDAKAMGVAIWLGSVETLVRSCTSQEEHGLINLIENADGSHCKERIHDRGKS